MALVGSAVHMRDFLLELGVGFSLTENMGKTLEFLLLCHSAAKQI